MRKIVTASLFFLLVIPQGVRAEMKWSGGAGVRNLNRTLNDGLNTKNAAGKDTSKSYNRLWQLRANVGVGDTSEHLDWNIGMRTQSSAVSEWVSFNNAGDLGFNLEQANVRLHTNEWLDSEWAVQIGRQKMGLMFDSVGQILFSKGVRWDGFSWSFKKGALGFNATQYVLGATDRGTPNQSSAYTSTEATQANSQTSSHFNTVMSFQPTFEWKVSDEVKAQFAVGYHIWQTGGNATSNGFTNTIHGGTAGTVGNVNPVVMDNPRQIQILTDWVLPYRLRFIGEYIRNHKTVYGTTANPTTIQAKRDAYALSLIYGAAKKKNDLTLMYTFSDRGIASSINTFSSSDIGADNISHMFEAKYMVADSTGLGARAQWHKEKAKVGGDGLALSAPNQSRLQKQQRLEFYAAYTF